MTTKVAKKTDKRNNLNVFILLKIEIKTCKKPTKSLYIKNNVYLCNKKGLTLRGDQSKKNNNIINIFIFYIIMAYVIGNNCIACGTCIDECPSGAISEGEKYSINPDVCTECGTCADVCPSEAISLGE